MAKIIGTIGRGISETAIVKMSVATDLQAIVAAANHSMNLERFSSTANSISNIAKNILTARNLPTDPRGVYQIKDDTWGQIDGEKDPDGNSFRRVMLHFNVPVDSPEGYAAQSLDLIEQITTQSDSDVALALALTLGGLIKEATLKSAWEPDALRGEKIARSAEMGADIAYGSREQRALKRDALKAEFETLLKSGKSKMDADLLPEIALDLR